MCPIAMMCRCPGLSALSWAEFGHFNSCYGAPNDRLSRSGAGLGIQTFRLTPVPRISTLAYLTWKVIGPLPSRALANGENR